MYEWSVISHESFWIHGEFKWDVGICFWLCLRLKNMLSSFIQNNYLSFLVPNDIPLFSSVHKNTHAIQYVTQTLNIKIFFF